MFTNTDMGSVLHVSVARCHWVILHLNDGDIKDLRNVGNTAYVYAMPSHRDRIHIIIKHLLRKKCN